MEEKFEFETMDKMQSKLSVGVFGPSGSGKTVAALKLAKGIQEQLYPDEDLKKIGLYIDTERRSSTKTVGRTIGGDKLEELELYNFEPPYDIVKLVKLVHYANSIGKKIIVIDSYTAFWSGEDGVLDRVASLEVELGDRKKQYGAWSEKEIITKKNILKNLVASVASHVIVCFRAKTDYVLEVNRYGKTAPRAIGVKEDTQPDIRYEFDAFLSIDKDTHELSIVKDRLGYQEIRNLEENPNAPISIKDGKELARIVSEGITPTEVKERKRLALIAFILKEKKLNSSKVAAIEKAKSWNIASEFLEKLPFETVLSIANYIK